MLESYTLEDMKSCKRKLRIKVAQHWQDFPLEVVPWFNYLVQKSGFHQVACLEQWTLLFLSLLSHCLTTYVNKTSQHSVLIVQKSAALRRLITFIPHWRTWQYLEKKISFTSVFPLLNETNYIAASFTYFLNSWKPIPSFFSVIMSIRFVVSAFSGGRAVLLLVFLPPVCRFGPSLVTCMQESEEAGTEQR